MIDLMYLLGSLSSDRIDLSEEMQVDARYVLHVTTKGAKPCREGDQLDVSDRKQASDTAKATATCTLESGWRMAFPIARG